MGLQVPPIVVKVEVEMVALPDDGETVEELAARLTAKGYTVLEIRSEGVLLSHTIEEQ